MKKFTVKDFIFYNGPCFSCGNKVSIKLMSSDNGESGKDLQQTFKDGAIEATLKIKYSFSLTLKIFLQNNKYQTSDTDKLIAYLGIRDLYFVSKCNSCRTAIVTNPLDFDNKGYVKALTLEGEILIVHDDQKDIIYNLITSFGEDKTEITIWNKNADNNLSLVIPALPLYRFKTREKLITKLKTYVIFS